MVCFFECTTKNLRPDILQARAHIIGGLFGLVCLFSSVYYSHNLFALLLDQSTYSIQEELVFDDAPQPSRSHGHHCRASVNMHPTLLVSFAVLMPSGLHHGQ